ncbi:MAG: ATP-binding cassette domain-containing protein [Bdellovibrionaceae bacterium]|nr:ATP-binding cassette domain-containing protein [Pseudobdellovibrionaceae bacterium]MBX3033164.1 ATP-binding cassette domain-containing protein [Pseudobdellovibrionaceae bacterium]
MSTERKNWSEREGLGEQSYQRHVFETLFFGYRPYLGRILTVLVVGLFGRGLLLGNANLIGAWVDGRIDLEARSFLLVLTAMATVGFLLTMGFRVIFSRLSAQAISQVYDEVTLRTSRYPMSFFDNTPAGRIITRFSSDYGNVFRLFGGPLAEFLSLIFDLILMLVLITVASSYFLVFVLVIAAMNYLVYRLNRNRLRILRRELSASRSPSIAHFAETTQGASTIRSFRREDSFRLRFRALDDFFLRKKLQTTRGIVLFSYQMNAQSAVLLLITGLASIWLSRHGLVTIGEIGVAFTFIVMSGNTLQMFFEWLSQLEEALIGVERLDRYLRLPLEAGRRLPSSARFPTTHRRYTREDEQTLRGRRLTMAPAASVEVRDLWFRYSERLPWVLKGLSFNIRPGERVGIIGRTGSGKSSLIQALFRLYPVEKGRILIDGQEARVGDDDRGADLNLYRRAIAFIAQDPVLFQGSLRQNLDLENRASDEDCFAALDRVGLGEWVRLHPEGLNLKVAERGKNLSLGERQLLCMARCLLQKAPVVIMDEATSAVDPQSEEILVKATEEFFEGRTQILIAHRLSTLEKCDRILWLDGGEVRRLGPAKEVMREFEAAAAQGDKETVLT